MENGLVVAVLALLAMASLPLSAQASRDFGRIPQVSGAGQGEQEEQLTKRAQASMDAAMVETRKLAKLRGYGPEQTEQLLRQTTTKIHAGIIESLLARGEPERARAYLEGVESREINTEARTKLIEAVRVANMPDDSVRLATELAELATESTPDQKKRFSLVKARDLLNQRFMERKISADMMDMVMAHLGRLSDDGRMSNPQPQDRGSDDLTRLLGADAVKECGLANLSDIEKRKLASLLVIKGIRSSAPEFAGLPADRELRQLMDRSFDVGLRDIVDVLTPAQCNAWMANNADRLDKSSVVDLLTDSQCAEIMSRSGWHSCSFGLTKKDGRDALWMQDGISRYYTTDLPFNFPTFRFSDGRYWCKKGLFGGAKELVINGEAMDLGLAVTWHPF